MAANLSSHYEQLSSRDASAICLTSSREDTRPASPPRGQRERDASVDMHPYALDVKSPTRVVIACDDGSETEPMSVQTVAEIIGARSYRKVTWRQGSRSALSARFAAVRVRPVTGAQDMRGEEQWLIIEKAERDDAIEHYVLATLAKSMSRKQIVRRIKQRWRTERAYEDLKGELGLDHFEGRTYTGWQHHISCVLACYAFLVAERARAFPPQTGGTRPNHTIRRAA